MHATPSLHLRAPPNAVRYIAEFSCSLTIAALADFILKTTTWQHDTESSLKPFVTEWACQRQSGLLLCRWHLKVLELDWVFFSFLTVQPRICLHFNVFEVFCFFFFQYGEFTIIIPYPGMESVSLPFLFFSSTWKLKKNPKHLENCPSRFSGEY